MLKAIPYDRKEAVSYAEKWAFSRNPAYLNFDGIGGDCTNFASQCLLAGCGVMNFTPVFGWFYRSSSDRTASWTGVQYLYNFLVNNDTAGPYAVLAGSGEVMPGDLVQLGNDSGFYHTPIITGVDGKDIYVAAHSYNAFMRPLRSYGAKYIRYLHIEGARTYV